MLGSDENGLSPINDLLNALRAAEGTEAASDSGSETIHEGFEESSEEEDWDEDIRPEDEDWEIAEKGIISPQATLTSI